LIAGILNLFRLNQVGINGLGNAYYAAAVQTMLTSWRHFFYLAFDPASFLAMDKSPLALWIQVASARLFGFHSLSLLLPQALAGIASVYVLYRLVRRAYGAWAGVLAALTLAVMPISVVTQRSNLPDALLVLTFLLAAWAVTRSVEQGSLRWLLMGAALVGLGFNIKMLQILLVVPALAALYLFGSPLSWRQRLGHAALAGCVMLLVASPWVLAVELTPPDQRPYIGGSMTNSVIELVFGYNGLARLWGEDFSYYLGPPAPWRLFNEKLAGQVSWLLPVALVGLLLSTRQVRHTLDSRRRQSLLLWSAWLIPQLIYFSISIFYHTYYLATLAPAIAALTGIGAEALWSMWQSAGWRRGWIGVALLGCGIVQALILSAYPAWGRWLIPTVLGLCLAVTVLLALSWRFERGASLRFARVAFVGGILALHIAPTVWAIIPVVTCTNMTLPVAGPQPAPCWPFAIRPFLDRDLVAYLEQHRQGARFMAATYSLGIAELGILETGEPFMTLGGYRGCDPILTVDEFAQLVAEGNVRFFLSLEKDQEQWPSQAAISRWVEDHCPVSALQSPGVQVRGPCDRVSR